MKFLRLRALGWLITACLLTSASASADDRPNILWIIVDDMSANFSCYGETAIETPHLDRMAQNGVMFSRAFVTAPVCSTNRSAFITGMYQTSIGAHHHRSGRGELKITLPKGVELVPKLFQNAGYYTAISGWPGAPDRKCKTDYNFDWDESVYDGVDWSGRADGQPFFAQIQTPGGKLRGANAQSYARIARRAEAELGSSTSVDVVNLPPYYPNDPVLLADWAAYLDSVRLTDKMIGEVLAKLEAEGELANTLVLFMTGHGISHARGKQFLYEEGIHVPLVIQGPGIEPGTVRTDLIEHIDIAALSLAAAGIEVPATMQAQDILAADYQPRDAVFAARDRCDETVDYLRSVRTERFKYIRNYLPERPHLMPNRYKDDKAIIIALRAAHAAGTLTSAQEELLFAETRAPEELYDLTTDPFEMNNLAADPAHATTLRDLRKRLTVWEVATHDHGRESEAMYDSDMADQLSKVKARQPDQLPVFISNIEQMKAWNAAGK